MKKEYQKLDMDIVEFDMEDIIVTSGTTNEDGTMDGDEGDPLPG